MSEVSRGGMEDPPTQNDIITVPMVSDSSKWCSLEYRATE